MHVLIYLNLTAPPRNRQYCYSQFTPHEKVVSSEVKQTAEITQVVTEGGQLQASVPRSPVPPFASCVHRCSRAGCEWVRRTLPHAPTIWMESAVQASHIRISGKAPLRLCLDLLHRSLSLNIFKYIWPLCIKFSRVRSKMQPCLNETIIDSLKPPFWSRGAELNSRFPIMTINVQNNCMCLQ